MRDLAKEKAAGFAGMGGFCVGGEALWPQLDSITSDGSMQELSLIHISEPTRPY